jgi:hypothetical protein
LGLLNILDDCFLDETHLSHVGVLFDLLIIHHLLQGVINIDLFGCKEALWEFSLLFLGNQAASDIRFFIFSLLDDF